MVAANILKNPSRTSDKGWYSSWEGCLRGWQLLSVKKQSCYEILHGSSQSDQWGLLWTW